mmetsp:Transcript_17175/g.36936  ORF Transcript_17175/g.36936 Transcript_17175/m.36936 type:complete len:121 (+) Transcript_17175:1283-1645(+)
MRWQWMLETEVEVSFTSASLALPIKMVSSNPTRLKRFGSSFPTTNKNSSSTGGSAIATTSGPVSKERPLPLCFAAASRYPPPRRTTDDFLCFAPTRCRLLQRGKRSPARLQHEEEDEGQA